MSVSFYDAGFSVGIVEIKFGKDYRSKKLIISLLGKHFFNISTNLEWVFSRADYKQKLLTFVFKI